jgi:hypothetical protein
MATNQATLQKERANNQGKTEVTRKLHRNKERTIWMKKEKIQSEK